MTNNGVRHVLSISGGKDSAALALYMKYKWPELDLGYVFCDTEKELAETYDYLDRLEAALGKPIVRLTHDGRGFDHWLSVYRGYLPSSQMRWCTRHLKLEPFERYIGDAAVVNYVGLRADEDRDGYVSGKPNIKAVYPFKEDGLVYADIERILEDAGVGMPGYRSWRSRSGCYFCFFQQKIEWVGLLENHPDLYRMAASYEKIDEVTGTRFTWCDNESLVELARPERVEAIKAEYQRRLQFCGDSPENLSDLFSSGQGCLICTL